ncbi:hypothetical protein [Sphingomonas sp.]|uniref:hypothetical protein n=1 Tax=Sphingomonas sp. TaxID=28214 RepID=UPI0035C86203
MGSFVISGTSHPSVVVLDEDRLPVRADVDVAHSLLSWLMHLHQCFERGSGLGLRLQRQPEVAIGCVRELTEVEVGATHHLGEQRVEAQRLSRQHTVDRGQILAGRF